MQLNQSVEFALPDDADEAVLVGRVFRPDVDGPSLVTIRGDEAVDITFAGPTMRDLCEAEVPARLVRDAKGESIGRLSDILANTPGEQRDAGKPYLLAPVDLQAVKAAGVTFAASLLERVIEEQARGLAERADAIRAEIRASVGGHLAEVKPGSDKAMALKELLVEKGLWSQYLEVGIGPDAEIFTKAQPMAAVGHLAEIGILDSSSWNNPEPEIVLVVASSGTIIGATLGNDVNLRDVEGRSALLLGKAKDNNASASVGPFVRLFDETFGLDDVRDAEVTLSVSGPDGYRLDDVSQMRLISRDPADLVSAMIGDNHQYPDGAILYLGTMFAPVDDRDTDGQGFTHKLGDVVTIASRRLGCLSNRVVYSSDAAPWTYGTSELMRNLARRGLI